MDETDTDQRPTDKQDLVDAWRHDLAMALRTTRNLNYALLRFKCMLTPVQRKQLIGDLQQLDGALEQLRTLYGS